MGNQPKSVLSNINLSVDTFVKVTYRQSLYADDELLFLPKKKSRIHIKLSFIILTSATMALDFIQSKYYSKEACMIIRTKMLFELFVSFTYLCIPKTIISSRELRQSAQIDH